MMMRSLCYLPLLFLHLSHAVSPTPAHGTPEEAGSGMSGPGGGSPAALLLSHLEDPTNEGDNSELDLMKRLYDFGLGKRAYSYVSEYKRLPVYNFGLGKRSNKMYGFGLGKRSPPGGHMYSFGLGKRDYDDYYQNDDEDEDIMDEEFGGDEGLQDDDTEELMDKRGGHMYSFGLGKRARPYSFGLGKRAPQQMYGFGLGKRGERRLYSFGLGKRPDGNGGRQSGSRFNFGLGKRTTGRQPFNFGLGKRSEDSNLVSELEDEIEQEGVEKRVAPKAAQRFAFGLGKREVAPGELEAVRMEENKDSAAPGDKKNTSAADSHHSGDIVKRSLQYAFGLGKRTPSYSDMDDVEEFSRLVRRPYSFGLGKRVPMYSFGIGKRSEH